jgi:hypothetical protein
MGRLEELDWITRNRLVMKSTLPHLKKSHQEWRQKPDRLKVMFWGPTSWERGGVDHMFATAMKARGHQVVGVRCAGELSACSMESVMFPRPDCAYCQDRTQKQIDIWGLDETYRKPILSEEKRRELKAWVENTADDQLEQLTMLELPIGKIAKADLPSYFMRLVDTQEPEVINIWRATMLGLAENLYVAAQMLDEVQPDRACLTSGRTTSHSGFYELCRAKGIPVVTWDEAVGGLGSFIFALNDHAVNYNKPRAWEKLSKVPLTKQEDDFVQYYFSKSSKGQFGRHSYYTAPITEKTEICSQLNLNPDLPITALLTNLTWDTSALDKAVFFDDMIDWLVQTIRFYEDRPNDQLVIRTHPAEGHLEDYARGKESVTRILNRQFPNLPSHIKVISGHEEINSHVLCDMASAIVVFTTTVGIEMAVKGRRVMSVGKSHYRGKGFTVDVGTKEDYFNLLTDPTFRENLFIGQDEVDLAKKYAHFFILGTEAYLDEFNQRDRHSYRIPDPKAFLPKSSKRWDRLCESLEQCEDFVDCTDYIDPWAIECD